MSIIDNFELKNFRWANYLHREIQIQNGIADLWKIVLNKKVNLTIVHIFMK